MGKQILPRAIVRICSKSSSTTKLARQDGEELYAEYPKRAIFDALWELTALNLSLESAGGHQNAEDASADSALMIATLDKAIRAHQ